MRVIEEYYCQFIDDYSAKQYLLALVEDDAGTFGVVGLFGRLGTPTLQITWKARAHASQGSADVVYSKARAERVTKSYEVAPKPTALDVVRLLANDGRIL